MKKIIETASLEEELTLVLQNYPIFVIAMGDGTNHKAVYNRLDTLVKKSGIPIVLVNEKFTTQEGKTRYFEKNPPKGLWKLVPLSFQSPPVPVDDYVAWIIGERYLEMIEKK